MSTLIGSYGKRVRPGLDHGAPSGLIVSSAPACALVRSPCAFRLRRLAQSACLVLLCSKGVVLQARGAHVLGCVHVSWQASDFRDILRSGTWFCMTGAGAGRRGTFGTLLPLGGTRC